MKYHILLLLNILFTTTLFTQELQKVSLQLQWHEQFQFAGYYVAKERGFYKQAGLDVELKKYTQNMNVESEVLLGRATYGIGRSTLISSKSKGEEIKLLAAIFQSSPLVIIALKELHVESIKEFLNKKIMTTPDLIGTASLYAMLNKFGISSLGMDMLKHTFNPDDLISKETDLMVSYISNEPFILREKGVDITIFDPKEYGFDFYSDILFSKSDDNLLNLERDLRFRDASLRGWEYAFTHISETVEMMLKKYNGENKSKEALLYEARELKKLSYYGNSVLGHIDENKINRIYDIYNIMGLTKDKIDMRKFILKSNKHREIYLSADEKEYLKKHKTVTFKGNINQLPFERYEKKSNSYIGIISDNLSHVEHLLNIKLVPQTNKSIDADIVSGEIRDRELRGKYKSVDSYMKNSIVILSGDENKFVDTLSSIEDKKVIILKNSPYKNFLYSRYPQFSFTEVDDIEEALKNVENKTHKYLLLPLTQATYNISKLKLHKVHIVGKTEVTMNMTIFVKKDKPMLYELINRATKMITQNEKKEALDKWKYSNFVEDRDYNILSVFSIILFLIFIFAIYIRERKNHTVELKKAKDEIQFLKESLNNK